MIKQKIQEKLNILPLKPGCYIFKDMDGNVLYVGKAKKLKNRVNQYFNRVYNNKTALLVKQIEDLEFIVTHTEKEALVLEINLIKQYYPPYNVIFKDDKHYPYIAISLEDYPRLRITRDAKNKKLKHYGPFPDSSAAYQTMFLLNSIYPLRKCKKIPNETCLYYLIKQCLGPCVNKIDKNVYQKMLDDIDKFFKGSNKDIIQDLTNKMYQCSENLEFERANEYKKLIEEIKKVTDKQIIEFNDKVNRDIVGFYVKEGYVSITILLYRNGYLNAKINEIVDYVGELEDILYQYLMQFYSTHSLPKEIFVSSDLDFESLSEFLNCKIINIKAGEKQELISLAIENAKKALEEKFMFLSNKNEDIFIQLASFINKTRISQIEMCDISHISGDSAVGGVIVFVNGYPVKNKYRKFIITGENKKNDLSSTHEVIYRRFYNLLKDNQSYSDLLIVDGGENQMKAAQDALNELSINVPVMGLKKDNHHRTNVLILPNYKEVYLDKNSKLFLFLMKMQEEVHRFAITFFKNKKTKSMVSSILDNIKGLGPVRKKRLLNTYSSLDEIKNAPLGELKQLLPEEVAINLKNILNKNNSD